MSLGGGTTSAQRVAWSVHNPPRFRKVTTRSTAGASARRQFRAPSPPAALKSQFMRWAAHCPGTAHRAQIEHAGQAVAVDPPPRQPSINGDRVPLLRPHRGRDGFLGRSTGCDAYSHRPSKPRTRMWSPSPMMCCRQHRLGLAQAPRVDRVCPLWTLCVRLLRSGLRFCPRSWVWFCRR